MTVARAQRGLLLSAASLLLATAAAGSDPSARAAPPPLESLCAALSRVGPGQTFEVTVSGILESGFEVSPFYDPDHPACEWDVSSSTCLRFPKEGFQSPDMERLLDRLLKRDGRARLTVRGTLSGPGTVDPDDPKYPLNWAYAMRVGSRTRYCHMSHSRTQLEVADLLAVRAVPKDVPQAGEFITYREAAPKVVGAALPSYPRRAQLVGITGDVVIRATVKKGVITEVTIVSGDRELSADAVDNVKTWTFAEDVDLEFTTTFEFRLELRKAGEGRHDRLELALPGSVKVTGAIDGW